VGSKFAASLVAAALAGLGASPASADPDCAGANHWPANMTVAQLKNAGVFRNEDIDFRRTTSDQIASERTGPDRWRQVFKVTLHRKDGGEVAAIAVSDASSGECSMGDVTVYRIDPASVGRR
jgi:hypothetical protein